MSTINSIRLIIFDTIILVIKVKGNDAKAFLDRQASNDLKDLSKPVLTAFLKANAEIVSLACVFKENDEIFIYCQDPDKLKEHLERFVIVEDVQFELGDCHGAAPLAMTEDASLKMTDPKFLEKYVSFTKGCFPGQEPLAKYKNIGLKKKEERSQKYLDEALEIFAHSKDSSELDPAIGLLRKALKENPKNEDAYESLGVMLAKQEKFQEAIQVMHMLEMINPQNQMAQMNLSIFYMKIGDKESAEEHKAKGTVLQFDEALKK